jgi:spore germination cell wall hydrolase CwlJ-like protein
MTMDTTLSDQTSRPRSAMPGIVFFALLGAAAIVAMTMPLTGWAHLLSLAGLGSAPTEPVEIALSDTEKASLVRLTEEAGQLPALTGDEAARQNEAIPFSALPVVAAKPFALPNVSSGAGLTALTCMTQAVYYEAAFEPLQGRRAVAQVVLNRMRHPAFPKSVCGVVYQGSTAPVCQFSFTCDGSLNHIPQSGAWAAAGAVARAALSGVVEPSVGSATHYHASYVSPYWAPKLTKLAQIGAHIFYRWPGGWGMPGAFTGRYAGVETIPAFTMPAMMPETTDEQTRALAEATLPANLVPIRHAENDIGGRLDVSKGWTLSIPDPRETRGASSAMVRRQQQGEKVAETIVPMASGS